MTDPSGSAWLGARHRLCRIRPPGSRLARHLAAAASSVASGQGGGPARRSAGAGSAGARRHGNYTAVYSNWAVIGLLVLLGLISWLVTRWRIEGGVLRIESGLLRRTSRRFPADQIQAVDTVRPVVARMFGLAEVRVRMAASTGQSGRLSYLTDSEAENVRARLLALAHGVSEHAPPPPEQVLITTPTARLIPSILLSGIGLVLEGVIVGLIILALLTPSAVGPALSVTATALLGLGASVFRRLNSDYHLTVAEAPDGLRLRSGLFQTAAETIPRGRVQGVRMINRCCGVLSAGAGWWSTWPASSEPVARVAPSRTPCAPCCRLVRRRRPPGCCNGSCRTCRGSFCAAAAGPLEVAAALPLSLLGRRQRLCGHDQRPLPPGDRLGAAGQGPEHPAGRGAGAAQTPAGHRASGYGWPQHSRRHSRPRAGRGARLIDPAGWSGGPGGAGRGGGRPAVRAPARRTAGIKTFPTLSDLLAVVWPRRRSVREP